MLMRWPAHCHAGRSSSRKALFASLAAGLGLAASLLVAASPAEAHHRHFHGRARAYAPYSPAFSALVIDANTGRTLYTRNEDELRHPASITKVMTLYLLFEQLEKGTLRLDSPIEVSAHAASMEPSKLGVPAGETVSVETAIKAVVTRSANDMAVAIAEKVGGTESAFADMMTAKAHELGMSRTHYANASGLPNDQQLTTAHDLIILGRDIQDRFPRYYAYFSVPSFNYNGVTIRTHDNLLNHLAGVDGIKTGYTNASGFNILTSVRRNGRHILAVIMGGTSARSRDAMMAGLVEDHLADASPSGPSSSLASSGPTAAATAPAADVADASDSTLPTASLPPAVIAPTRNVIQHATVADASVLPERPRPAFVTGAPKITPDRTADSANAPANRRAALDGSTTGRTASTALAYAAPTTTPSTLRWVTGPRGVSLHGAPQSETKVATADPAPEAAHSAIPAGVMIQIGATDDIDQATELLNRAKTRGAKALASARPFTQKVQKGDTTLYRARFAGLDDTQAEAACRTLKQSGFACFTTKN